MQIYKKIKKGIHTADFPKSLPNHTKEVVLEMCAFEPHERLCLKPGGPNNLKKHAWYASVSFDWSGFASFSIVPPYKPKVKSKTDMVNFRCEDELPPTIEYKDDGSGWDRYFASDTRNFRKMD